MKKFSLDTNVFIEAWYRHYPIDIFPDIWRNISILIDNKTIIVSIAVHEELERQDDELFKWVDQKKPILCPKDEELQIQAKNILNQFPKLVTNVTRSIADPYVVALGKIHNLTVVTYERKKDKIPDVCRALKIDCMDFVTMMRELKWEFSIK